MRKKALIYAVLMTLVIAPLQAVNALTVSYGDEGVQTSSGSGNSSGGVGDSGYDDCGPISRAVYGSTRCDMSAHSGGVSTNDSSYGGVPGAGSGTTGSSSKPNSSGGVGSEGGSSGTTGSSGKPNSSGGVGSDGSTSSGNTSGGVSTTDPGYKGVPGAESGSSGKPNSSGGVNTGDNGYKGVPGDDGRGHGYNPGPSHCNGHYYPKDIDGHWAEIYIRRLYDLCILEGYNDGSFHPNQKITRAELTKMALYARGINPNNGCYDNDCGSPFVDLDSWQGKWIRPAWDKGIVEGYKAIYCPNPNGYSCYMTSKYFRPNNPITRAEAVKVVLATYGEGQDYRGKSFFNDVKGWSVGWIERAHNLGIVQGIGNGNFDPNRSITRAEAAKIIAKMMEHWDTKIR